MSEHTAYIITVKEAKTLEPLLKPTFNYTAEFSLSEELCCTKTNMKFSSQWTDEEKRCAELCKDENGVRNANKFGLMFDDDTLAIHVPATFPYTKLEDLLNQYISDEDSIVKEAVKLMTALLYRGRNEEMSEIEYIADEYDNYIYNVRPDMLKLYLALHNENRQGNDIRVSFGGGKLTHLENSSMWVDMILGRYLTKYLGVSSVKEAQKELDTIYYKLVGRKHDSHEMDKYIWGLHHLLDQCFKKPRKINKFILDYLTIVELYDSDKDTWSKDVELIKQRWNALNKLYQTVEELYASLKYKLSPNNPDPFNCGTFY